MLIFTAVLSSMNNVQNQINKGSNLNHLNKIRTYAWLFLIGIILVYIAGFRTIGFDRDSISYLDSFDSFIDLFDSNYLDKEPTFWLITWMSNLISENGVRLLFVTYAVLVVSISFTSIVKITSYPLAAVFCYIFLFFPLHGMTQIRAGVACAIFMYSISDIVEKKPGSFFIKSALATMFHYSAVVIFILYLLKPRIINVRFYLLLPLIGLFFVFFRDQSATALGSMALLLPDFIGYKLSMYSELLQDGVGEDINLFSIYYTSLLVMYYYLVFNIEKFEGKYGYILIKLLGWTLFVYYFASFLPAIAVRVSELYGAVVIFIIPMLAYSFKEKILPLSIAILFVLVIFVNNVFVHSLFNF